ncbi:MAG: hypothetical protein Kow0059_09790 [Candidatus Sumerlaeia bacterium]
MDARSQGSYGSWAQGFYGDYILSNAYLRATISNVSQENNLFPSGGFLLDISRADLPLDYFSHIHTLVEIPTLRKLVYKKADFVESGYPRGAKAVVVSGFVEGEEQFKVKTEYILEPNSRFLRLKTTFRNETGREIGPFKAYDEVNWGAMVVLVPGYSVVGQTIDKGLTADWIGGFMDDFSLVLGSPEPATPLHLDQNYTISHIWYQNQPVTIANGQEWKLERLLLVGDTDMAGLAAELYQHQRQPLGIVSGTMLETGTNKPIPNTEIRVVWNKKKGGEYVPSRPFTKTISDEKGRFILRLPEGSYFIKPTPYGRLRNNLSYSVDVYPNRTLGLELTASPPVYLNYEVLDSATSQPIACKLTFVNIKPTPFPNLGPPHQADGARNTIYSATGRGRVQLDPGYYGVFVSHGVEYEVSKNEIEVKATGENMLRVALKREMPVEGYVSLDFGVRTNHSWDTPVTPRDRVVSAAAEGVDMIVTGDTNTATDLTSIIEELNLQSRLKAVAGMRVEYDNRNTSGSFLVFPAPPNATINPEELFKAPDMQSLFGRLRRSYPQAMIAVMRPLMPIEGYFSRAGFDDREMGLLHPEGLSFDFDFLEVWDGKRQGVIEMNNNLMVWLNYNNYYPGMIAGSNSHTLFGEETGYPRVYVQSSQRDPRRINMNEIIANIKAGKVIITNGPWIEFKVNGKGLGEVVTDPERDKIIDCEMIIRAPRWVQTDYIDILGDGTFRKRIIRRSYGVTQHYPNPEHQEDARFRMRIIRDMILQVRVMGSRSLEPVVTKYGSGDEDYVRAYALSGPIYLDMDGDGKFTPPGKFASRAE